MAGPERQALAVSPPGAQLGYLARQFDEAGSEAVLIVADLCQGGMAESKRNEETGVESSRPYRAHHDERSDCLRNSCSPAEDLAHTLRTAPTR